MDAEDKILAAGLSVFFGLCGILLIVVILDPAGNACDDRISISNRTTDMLVRLAADGQYGSPEYVELERNDEYLYRTHSYCW